MARDAGLEQLLTEDLAALENLRAVGMFGGLAWLWQGNLLCCANSDGILLRLGQGNDAWALEQGDVQPMVMGGRAMRGWVHLSAQSAGNDPLRRDLLRAAQRFVETLSAK